MSLVKNYAIGIVDIHMPCGYDMLHGGMLMTQTACIAVWTNKGGNGKTCTATTLARWSGFGAARLLIDLDPQANASLACGFPLDSRRLGISEALLRHSFPENPQLHVDLDDGTVFIPADIRMPDLDLLLHKTNGTPTLALAQLLSDVDGADIIVIDCPPGENIYSRMALAAADYLLIPTTLDSGAATGIQQALSVCKKIKFGNPARNEPARNENLKILGVFFNKVPSVKVNICEEIRKVIVDFCKNNEIRVFNSEIKERISPMTYIGANQQSVFELPENNKLRIEFTELCKEVKEALNER